MIRFGFKTLIKVIEIVFNITYNIVEFDYSV